MKEFVKKLKKSAKKRLKKQNY